MRSAPSLALALVLASCGASSAAPTAPTPTEAAGPPRPWAELSRDERAAHMAREVLPRMTDLFVAYDPSRYDAFTCATCHGEGAREREYAMPNPALLPLWPTGTEGQHQTVRDHPEGVRFMYSRVMPAMQALLGAPEFDASTGEGFSCFACHPHAQ
ncbi:hypothetical protein [Sandaracinus amylolyticus]|uniref:Cytochrome c family protein n=1 Tax=Sandaracinus amylolyticus TaxID=927083 RepID=A0A0F6W1L6_9BACT|nr:hypothetical protein [Sandaracinus amylolyticus]AKF05117.1 hypothetical protein DB32_002266 [Sandaracinus amylolyticus]